MSLSTENKYAVVGMGGILPGAQNLDQFWQNLVDERVEIQRLPADSLERAVFFRPDVLGRPDKADSSYTDLLATTSVVEFDGRPFRIPPTAAARMDKNQQLSLLAAEQALAFNGLKDVDRDRVCVFMGSSMVGQLHHDYVARLDCRKYEYLLHRHPDFCAGLPPETQQRITTEVRDQMLGNAPSITEDTAPGVLPNIIAARISAAFDLHGHAYVVDAACASGLAAILCGVQQLQLRQADAVICGAVDVQNGESGRTYFSGMGALSAEGSFPFDERASGFVIGDGAGALVLKRLDDAISAGDRIFAVVTGFGQTSDGKGKAIAAPNELWQAQTIQRAWAMAGVPADSVELIEAHATSTQVGDLSEVNALKLAFAELGASRVGFCGIGSVKSNIGHLKSAAGIAGFLKAVLALERKYLPPTAGIRRLNPKLQLEHSPFYVLSSGHEWRAKEHPRRAGVSAFGFGGANYHIALEEFRREDYGLGARHHGSLAALDSKSESAARPLGPQSAHARAATVVERTATQATRAARATQYAVPLFVHGGDIESVRARLARLLEALQTADDWVSLLLQQDLQADAAAPVRMALYCHDRDELLGKLERARRWHGDPVDGAALQANGIVFQQGKPLEPSQTAVLFPGQGSQYPDMQRELLERFESVRSVFARADAVWRTLAGHGVTELIDSSQRGRTETEQLLRQTQHTHPTLVVSSLATFHLLDQVGFHPAVAVGHSVGEFTALAAGRRLSFREALALVGARASAFGEVARGAAGGMLALPISERDVRLVLREANADLAIANVNGPAQTIVSGSELELTKLAEHCAQRGITAIRLNVSHAFHSPLMLPAESKFQHMLKNVAFRAGSLRIMANGVNEYYGSASADVQSVLATQITGSVRFETSIRRLYADGIRLFVEVGPGSVLSGLTREMLAGKDALVLASDTKRGDSDEALIRLICALFAAGIEVDPTLCFATTPPALSASTHAEVAPPRTRTHLEAASTPTRSGLDSNGAHPIPPRADGQDPVRVVYSGVAIGLPGSFKNSFRDDNFEQLFEGRNHIERLSDDERQRLVDLRVSKLVKSEQGASFMVLSSLNEVIQLAGKLGQLDLRQDYGLPEKEIASMSTAIAHALAAGYEALRDAKIPLVREYARTAAGSLLPERWALPQEMQAQTGVIFANGFPMVDPIIREVSRHLSYRFGNRTVQELFDFYDTLIARVSDGPTRKLLADWYALNRGRMGQTTPSDEVYQFNHQLMTQISMQANNRLARCINARGPNFQINAACSSTSTAISLAEDMIRGGRARHMIVIGADDPTSRDALPYLGAGFLSTGACTNAADLYEAALPFDRRRNGMIMGAGAVALVIESERECVRRGTNPVCELLGSHVFNTAGHASQLDVPRYAEELEQFMRRMEAQHSIERGHVASSLVYLSHETFTPPRGGCSESEAVALRHVFGARVSDVEVSNTKGMTGHTMGAALEDAVAARALESGRTAPIVNFREADPILAGLKLSDGTPRQFDYALRMAAGFGSQGNYILLRRWATSGGRIASEDRYQRWLRSISSIERPELAQQGRVLVVKDTQPGAVIVNRPNVDTLHTKRERGAATSSMQPARATALPPESAAIDPMMPQPDAPPPPMSVAPQEGLDVRSLVLELVSEVTGYAASILELDMELEADLGIDTVKQATVVARLAERMRLGQMSTLRLSDYPTLRSIVDWCESTRPRNEQVVVAPTQMAGGKPDECVDRHSLDAIDRSSSARPDRRGVPATTREQVLSVIAEVTGYSVDILDVSMELEADLGIDTVKQATILALLSERSGVTENAALKMSEFSTVGQLVAAFAAPIASAVSPKSSTRMAAPSRPANDGSGMKSADESGSGTAKPPMPQQSEHAEHQPSRPERRNVSQTVYELLANLTAYPADMLEDDLSLQGDLGLSAAVVAQFRDALARTFGFAADFTVPPDVRLRDLIRGIELAGRESPSASGSLHDWSSRLSAALGRQVLALRPAPSVRVDTLELERSLIWVIGDDVGAVSMLQGQFESHHARVRTLVFAAEASPNELDAALESLVEGGSPDLVVDLTASPSALPLLDRDPEQAMAAIAQAADFRFALYKRLLDGHGIQRVLAVTGLDGSFALTPDGTAPIDAIYGLHIGFYKALRKTWRGCQVSILDVAPSFWANGGTRAMELIEHELGSRGPGVEVCYLEGCRHRLVVEDSSWDDVQSGEPLSNEVVVATGGGAGITARILLELARRSPAHFALVGRTELDAAALGLDFTDPKLVEAERARVQRELEAERVRVTPRAISERLERRHRSAEICATIAELERLGSTARYHRADAADPVAIQAVLAQIRETMGAITTVICGAGLEVSHTLGQKTLEEFQRVHRVKSVGAYLLAWCCRNDPLRRFVALSSISGRFGNAAQLDYSAANSFLDLMMRTHRRHGVRALSLLWSGWSELGMAWRNNYVRETAERAGLSLIPPQAGARVAALEILAAEGPSEVLVHRGLGDIVDSDLSSYDPAQYPLIDWVEKRSGRITTIHRRVSHLRDALLDQHRFAGVPYMPGVGFMEMMAESARLISATDGSSVVFRELEFLAGFKLHHESPRDVWLELEPGSVPDEYLMTIKAAVVSAASPCGEPRRYATARVALTNSPPPVALDPAWDFTSTASTDYATLLEAARARRHNVHFGPLFNDACALENCIASPVRWSAQGLESRQRLPQAQLTHAQYPLSQFQLNPAFLDALHQAGAVLALELTGHVYLPVGADEFVIFHAPSANAHYRVLARLNQLSDSQAFYDMVMVREDGVCCASVRNSRFARISD